MEQPQMAEAAPQNPMSSEKWLKEISAAEKNSAKWREQAERINKRYLDKRTAGEEDMNRLNLFTTNTNILLSTLYARFPKPLVLREFEDADDDVARVAGTIIERMLLIRERDDFDCAISYVVQDRLVPGLGITWARYEPTITTEEIPAAPAEVDPVTGMEIAPAQEASSFERIVDEECLTDYVHWQDFLWSPCRTWEECRWVARRVKMTKDKATKRFGDLIANQLSYKTGSAWQEADSIAPEDSAVNYAEVYEIWVKATKEVIWVSKGFDSICDKKPDLLGLSKFFPCPKPLAALTSTSDFMPRPDFLLVQDQYNELDELNNRITVLERAVKVVGIYDGTNEELKRIFTSGIDNTLIGSTNYAQFAQQGGFKGAIDWVPLDMVVGAIEKLRQYRQDLIAQIYELTGISDIMRGSTKATETLGAQQLKAQYGSVRLNFMQMEVARFVEEALTIKAEVIRNKFQPETLVARSNIERTNDTEYIQQALDLLKDPMWKYRIQVHADTMAVPEFNAERDARMDFVRAMSEYLMAATPMIQQDASTGVFLLKTLQWAAAGFRNARQIESVMDEAVKALEMKVKQPPPPPPPKPEEVAKTKHVEAQAEKVTAEAEGQQLNNLLLADAVAQVADNPGSAPIPGDKPPQSPPPNAR